MINEDLFVFKSVHTVAAYLQSLENKPLSPLRLHKTLYFLFAYYGASYRADKEESVVEGFSELPPYLFPARFEAWDSGPVIRELYDENQECIYTEEEVAKAVEKVEEQKEVQLFIQELREQTNAVSEYTLRFRSKEDESWKTARSFGGKTNELIHDEIVTEYKKHL